MTTKRKAPTVRQVYDKAGFKSAGDFVNDTMAELGCEGIQFVDDSGTVTTEMRVTKNKTKPKGKP